MVTIHYCPKCAKASREHLFKKIICNVCRTQYETVEVTRSRFYIIQFVFLLLGFMFLISAFVFTNPFERVYEFLGISIIAISMWIFTLYFQLLDSRDMEYRAEQQQSDEKRDSDEPKLIAIRRLEREEASRERGVPANSIDAKKRPMRKSDRETLRGGPPPRSASRVRRAMLRKEFDEDEEKVEKKSARPKAPVIKDMAALLREAEDDEDK